MLSSSMDSNTTSVDVQKPQTSQEPVLDGHALKAPWQASSWQTEAISLAIWQFSAQGMVQYANAAAQALLAESFPQEAVASAEPMARIAVGQPLVQVLAWLTEPEVAYQMPMFRQLNDWLSGVLQEGVAVTSQIANLRLWLIPPTDWEIQQAPESAGFWRCLALPKSEHSLLKHVNPKQLNQETNGVLSDSLPESLIIHELRSPLIAQKYLLEWALKSSSGALTGTLREASDTLRNGAGGSGKLPSHLKEPLEKILETNHDMLRLIQKLLQLNHLQQGYALTPQDTTPVNLAALLEGLKITLTPLAHSKKVTLTLQIPPHLPTLFTDEALLKDLYLNLLENAIEHSAIEQTVLVKVMQTPQGSLCGLIANVGAPLSEAYRQMIAEATAHDPSEHAHTFLRLHRKGPLGKGLGLSIACRLARVLNGSLCYEYTTLPEFDAPANCFLWHLPIRL